MKAKYIFKMIEQLKQKYGFNFKNVETFEDVETVLLDDSSHELDDLNPFEIISGEVMPNHVEQFIKDKSDQDLQKFWEDEIKLNGGK
jgi:REP element-mobilizing transposase RayT